MLRLSRDATGRAGERWTRGVAVLIVVVPGIGGSVLAEPGDDGRPVWDAGPGDVVDLLRHPDQMNRDRRLVPVGLTHSTKLLGFTVVPGYEGLLAALRGCWVTDERGDPLRPVPGARVVAVPYDFRAGVAAAAERLDAVVDAHLGDATEGERAGRVVVVAHSLGGLVARYWMGPMGRWRWCRSLVTIGTPHRGAPKALDWYVNGVRLLGRTLPGPTQLLRDWPSVAELLPRYRAVRAIATGSWCYPHELPLPGLAGPAAAAYRLHQQIEQAWAEMPRRGPEMLAWLGWSHPTFQAAVWNGTRLRVGKTHPGWLAGTGWEKDYGDGTVPAISAVPIEDSHHAATITRLTDRHVPMINSPGLRTLLGQYLTRTSIDWVRGDTDVEHPPTLGLELPELHPVGDLIPVAVMARENRPGPGWAAGVGGAEPDRRHAGRADRGPAHLRRHGGAVCRGVPGSARGPLRRERLGQRDPGRRGPGDR